MKRYMPISTFKAGIYRLKVVLANGDFKYYIGQTVDFKNRSNNHFRNLRKGKHRNYALQADFNKLGEAAFSFERLLICAVSKEVLDLFEQLVLDSYTLGQVYNLCLQSVGSRTGIKSRPETCAAISIGKTGYVCPEEIRLQISKTKKERGQRPSDAHMQLLFELSRKRGSWPKEAIEAGANARRGKKKPPEEILRRQETRRKNAEARGYWTSCETRVRLCAARAKRSNTSATLL